MSCLKETSIYWKFKDKIFKFASICVFWSLFLNKVSDLKVCNFIKKRLQHRCFAEKFVKFSGTTFLQNNSGGVSRESYPCIHQASFNLKLIITVSATFKRVAREGEGGTFPLPFFGNWKKCPNSEKKCPDCGHLC